MERLIRIGTRGSALAQAQAQMAKASLEKAHPGLRCELVVLKTTGDDPTLWEKEDSAVKGLFVKEIEEALLADRVDCGVHSVKDMETQLPSGLILGAILKREDPRDALISRDGKKLKDMPNGTSVGASSLRRQAQLNRIRRDLSPVDIRGNVESRLRKMDSGEVGALILAVAGLSRLGLSNRISEILDSSVMVPCTGQGALAIEIVEKKKEIAQLVQAVDHPDSRWEITAERALLKALGGNCRVPIGALARVDQDSLTLKAAVLSPEGLKLVKREISGPKEAAERLGKELASHLRAMGADRLLYGNWQRAR